LPVIEGDHLTHEQKLGLGKERVGPQALREPLAPGRAGPAEIADVPAGERRQAVDALQRSRSSASRSVSSGCASARKERRESSAPTPT